MFPVILKTQWDYLPHIVGKVLETKGQDIPRNIDNFHCHVIRRRESDYLMDFFRRRREGALLVSGKRGVGKSSAIISAVIQTKEVLSHGSDKVVKQADTMELLPVLVNGPNFENLKSTEKDESDDARFLAFKRSVLQNLVRALYQAALRDGIISGIDISSIDINKLTRNNKNRVGTFDFLKLKAARGMAKHDNNDQLNKKIALKNKISYLFRRAVAAEVKTQANLKELRLDKFVREEETTFKADWSLVWKPMTISIPLAITAAFLLPVIGVSDVVSKVAPVVISITPPVIAISYRLRQTITNQTQAEKDASIFYLYDYDLSTLQSELEETINLLTKNNKKVVFIVDELDKIPREKAKRAIESLKSLFNQASALFVMVGGQEFYNLIVKAKIDRAREYTIFSQKIYLRRPQFAEIKKFMDIIADPNENEPIIKLFAWNKLQRPARINEILEIPKTVNTKMFEDIKNAEFSKEGKTITITYTIDEGQGPLNKTISIVDDDKALPVELKIPSSSDNKIIEKYDFGVVKYKNESFVYSRTSDYRRFQYYAAYASKSDFFDLYNVLRDRITYVIGDERPRLDIDLDEKQVTQAKLQEVVEEIFLKSQSNNPSVWHENDRLLTLMYDLITKLSEPPRDATHIRIERAPYRIVFYNENKPDEILAEVPDMRFYNNDDNENVI